LLGCVCCLGEGGWGGEGGGGGEGGRVWDKVCQGHMTDQGRSNSQTYDLIIATKAAW